MVVQRLFSSFAAPYSDSQLAYLNRSPNVCANSPSCHPNITLAKSCCCVSSNTRPIPWYSACLIRLNTGAVPLSNLPPVSPLQHKPLRRRQSQQPVSFFQMIQQIPGYFLVDNPFYRNGRRLIRARRRRKRIRPSHLPPLQREQEGKELSRPINKGLIIHSFQKDRCRIPGLWADTNDSKDHASMSGR